MKSRLLGGLLLLGMTTCLAAEEPRLSHDSPGVAGDLSQAGKALIVSIRLCERDGSQEDQPIRVLSRPMVMTRENVPASVAIQQKVPVEDGGGRRTVEVGRQFECRPSAVKDGKLRLAIKFFDTQLAEQTDQLVRFDTQGTEVIAVAKLGWPLKIDLPATDRGDPLWLEVIVEEAQHQATGR